MAIITISRGAFSEGKKLAECLSEKLGYRSISREILIQAASAAGISEQKLLKAIEQPVSEKERLGLDIDRLHYLSFIQAALCEEAKDDNIVYHGFGGHVLLIGIPHLIKVKVIAAMELRAKLAMETLKFTREEAVAYLVHMDDLRTKWTKFLYNVDWNEPSQYDKVIDFDKTTMTDACNGIVDMTKYPEFQTTEASRKAMNDLLLISREKQQLHQKMLQK